MLLKKRSLENITREVSYEKQTPETIIEKTQAKMLRMVSHNPQTQARFFVNANKAIQYGDKITLNNPVGIFEKPEGPGSLKSTQASYYKTNREGHFLRKLALIITRD